MIRLIKKIFSFLWKFRKRIGFVILFTLLFFSLRFPWKDVVEKGIQKVQEKVPVARGFEPKKTRLGFFPPRLVLQEVSYYHKKFKKPLLLDALSFSPDWMKWLAFKPSWKFYGKKGPSSLSLTFWGEERTLEEIQHKYWIVKAHSPYFSLEILEDVMPRIKISGLLSFDFQSEWSLREWKDSKASLELKGTRVHLLPYRLDTAMGPLEFPEIKWTEGKAILRLKEGTVLIESLRLGRNIDDFYLQFRGNAEIFRTYKRFRLGAYDFQAQIDVSKSFKMGFMDLMLSGTKEELGAKYRYKVRITGQGLGPPNIEKIV